MSDSHSATCIYYAVQQGQAYTYVVLLTNTSPSPWSIGQLVIGGDIYPGTAPPASLQNMVPVSVPNGWWAALGFGAMQYGTIGPPYGSTSPPAGIILPGQVGVFAFQSSSSPPATMPFGVGYYNTSNGESGFAFNGIANLVDCVPPSSLPIPFGQQQVMVPQYIMYLVSQGLSITQAVELILSGNVPPPLPHGPVPKSYVPYLNATNGVFAGLQSIALSLTIGEDAAAGKKLADNGLKMMEASVKKLRDLSRKKYWSKGRRPRRR